jgi:precorrin-8X/cobalt-precorrin-8 methylmutase
VPERLYDPEEITRRSYEHIDENLDGPDDLLHRAIARRVVHTTGDFDIVGDLWFSEGLRGALQTMIDESFPVVTDVTMVESGIRTSLLDRYDGFTDCFVHGEETERRAQSRELTRSAAGLDCAVDQYSSFVLVVGNAPTVLFRLLDRSELTPRDIPLVVGAPVGFVSVEQSKRELRESKFVSVGLAGNRGGSPVAASITNALIEFGTETNNG